MAMAVAPACSRIAVGRLAVSRGFSAATRPVGSRAPRSLAVRALASSAVSADEHAAYIKDVAAFDSPAQLGCLLRVMEAQGEKIMRPSERGALHPLVIPVSRTPSGEVTGLLRWPTPPEMLGLQVVRAGRCGLTLLGLSVDQYLHRRLAEEDAATTGPDAARPLAAAAGPEGARLYARGAFAAAGVARMEVYLLKQVGKFPDVMERLALGHLERGDEMSALIAGEWMYKGHFPGWGRAAAFNAELLTRAKRPGEARDAARMAFRSPWWTLGTPYKVLAEKAGFENKPVDWVQSRLTEEAAANDIQQGKAPAQVALDQAALLMDRVASGLDGDDGTEWDRARKELVAKYQEAGFPEVARFIAAGGD